MRTVEERLELFYKQLNGLFIARYDHPTEIEIHIGESRERLFIWTASGKLSRPCTNKSLAKVWWGTREGSKYGGKTFVSPNTSNNALEAALAEDAAFEKEFMLMQALQKHSIPIIPTETVNGSGEVEQPQYIKRSLETTFDPGAHYRFKLRIRVTEADLHRGHIDVKLDPYRVFKVYGITHPAQQHAGKKILCAGKRGHNDTMEDIKDSINALERWEEMLAEDAANAE